MNTKRVSLNKTLQERNSHDPAENNLREGIVATHHHGTTYGYSCRITRAGDPTAKQRGGISLTTTLPAPMTLPAPIVTPRNTVTRAPSQTFSSRTIGADFVIRCGVLAQSDGNHYP